MLLCGVDAFLINAADFKSLQHLITNICMKMFANKSDEVVTECQQVFGFQAIRNQLNCDNIRWQMSKIFQISPIHYCAGS